MVYVTHMLEGWGKETRSLGYDPSEREVIADPTVSEERQPDVSSAIKYSNVGAGLCDLPRTRTQTSSTRLGSRYIYFKGDPASLSALWCSYFCQHAKNRDIM